MKFEMSFPEYIEALKATLQYWLDAHFKFNVWVEGYRDSETETFYSTMEQMEWKEIRTSPPNGRFWLDYEFDIRKLAAKHTARRVRHNWVRCSKCGSMDEFYTYCGCNSRTRTPRAYEVEELIVDCELTNLITDEDIVKALKVVWNTYAEQMHPQLQGIREEIKDALKALKKPTLEAILWANHLKHINGVIAEDYGGMCGLPYELVEEVSNQGLEAIFGEEIYQYV